MTNDPTRPVDPWSGPHAGAPAPAPGFQPTAAGPAPAGPAPAYIPAGIVARPEPGKSSGRVSLLTAGLVIAALIAAVGVGFAAGRVTAPQATNGRGQAIGNGAGFPNASGRTGNGGGFGGFASGNISISGSVVALGDGSITIQPEGGSGTVTVQVPSTATYHAQGSASSSDVAVGTQVQVTATRPTFRGGPDASGAPGASGAPNAIPGANGLNLSATDILVIGK
jgi:hypothetical protein